MHRDTEFSAGLRHDADDLGWLALIGGAARILAPQRIARFGRSMMANPSTLPISTGIYLVFGALLTFFGYRH